MSDTRNVLKFFGAVMGLALFIPGVAYGGDSNWRVGKSSGAVWVTKSQAQPVSLTSEAVLHAGDNITTGRNGRVMLIRGEERIIISPNSAVGIPKANANGMDTTITQRAGTILLEVEKKNVPHFEVETPYLAAVVKGTRFRVTVDSRGARVDVTRGKVQVADFKSGQFALVLPGQAAKVLASGSGGLSLTGKGQLSPIERGKPRATSVQALAVPKSGLKPAGASGIDKRDASAGKLKNLGAAGAAYAMAPSNSHKGALRINAPIGEMKVDFHKVTKGLAHGTGNARAYGANKKESIFSESQKKGIGQVDDTGKSTANGNGGAASAIALSNAGGNGNGVAGANGNAGGNGNGVAGANSNAGGNGKAKGKNK
jgi:hypothetical protein